MERRKKMSELDETTEVTKHDIDKILGKSISSKKKLADDFDLDLSNLLLLCEDVCNRWVSHFEFKIAKKNFEEHWRPKD